ncbi:MAG: radical SAM protein [bacterium]
MKANNLSICIPNYGCNKNCPYCISKMTGYVDKNVDLFYRNLQKVKSIADRSNVNSISFTSKGEILYHYRSIDILTELIEYFSSNFALELQTNGTKLNENIIKELHNKGLDTIAISIDNHNDFYNYSDIISLAKQFGFTIRTTVNLLPNIYKHSPLVFFKFCLEHNVDQISFRNISVPTNYKSDSTEADKTINWIEKNINNQEVEEFIYDYKNLINKNGNEVMKLPYGAVIYDVFGISTTYFDYCIQDQSNGEDIRSLIYHEDGHLSTTWYGSHVGRIL